MKKVKKFLLGRATIVALAILIQLLWILSFLYGFQVRYSFVNSLLGLLAIFVVLVIVNKNSNPSYKIAWAVLILSIPIVGLLIYYIFGRSDLTKWTRKRMEAVNQEIEREVQANPEWERELRELDPSAYCQSTYIKEWANYPVYKNTATQYYPSGEEMFPAILEALESAEHFIFMEYFIVEEGYMFGKILDILKRKAAKGLDVRFVYDDFGCVTTLPAGYYRQMEAWGIRCVRFNPLYPVMSVIMNNRDHRKILVVDGKVGFTGGINLADEYINLRQRFGHWKDTGIMLKGEAVWNLTVMFLQMWSVITKMPVQFSGYVPHRYHPGPFETDGFVQPYCDTPLDDEIVGENVYLNMIGRAERYVYICTPYLIIDNEMMTALCLAAKSGVDVRIMTPGIPDKKIVFLLTRSYYEQLIEAGVKIYEYLPGFLHAKSFVCDDELAVIGTINMDYRSLYLHFENGVWLYRCRAVEDMRQDYLESLKMCMQVTLDRCRDRNIVVRAAQSVLRLFAPML